MKSNARIKPGAEQAQQVMTTLSGEGKRLNESEQRAYSSRFGHDFSRVRVFDGPSSGAFAKRIGARGVAVKGNVVLGDEGERDEKTLEHELAHVAQMERSGTTQSHESAEKEARSAASGQHGQLHASASGTYLDDDEEKKVPETDSIPSPDAPVAETPAAPTPVPQLFPAQLPTPGPTSGSQLPADFWSSKYNIPPQPNPWAAPGKGPDTPRPGTPGDVLKGVTSVPAVSRGLTNLGDQAKGDLSKAWSESMAAKIAMGATGASMAAGLALPLILPQSREAAAGSFPYSALQNTKIPFGPAGVQFNLAGPDKNFHLMFDLAKVFKHLQ